MTGRRWDDLQDLLSLNNNAGYLPPNLAWIFAASVHIWLKKKKTVILFYNREMHPDISEPYPWILESLVTFIEQ